MACIELVYSPDVEFRKYTRLFLGSRLHLFIFGFTLIYLQLSGAHFSIVITASFAFCTAFGCLWAAMDKKPLISIMAAGRAARYVMPIAYAAFLVADQFSRACGDNPIIAIMAPIGLLTTIAVNHQ